MAVSLITPTPFDHKSPTPNWNLTCIQYDIKRAFGGWPTQAGASRSGHYRLFALWSWVDVLWRPAHFEDLTDRSTMLPRFAPRLDGLSDGGRGSLMSTASARRSTEHDVLPMDSITRRARAEIGRAVVKLWPSSVPGIGGPTGTAGP